MAFNFLQIQYNVLIINVILLIILPLSIEKGFKKLKQIGNHVCQLLRKLIGFYKFFFYAYQLF